MIDIHSVSEQIQWWFYSCSLYSAEVDKLQKLLIIYIKNTLQLTHKLKKSKL